MRRRQFMQCATLSMGSAIAVPCISKAQLNRDSNGGIFHSNDSQTMKGAQPLDAVRVNLSNYHEVENRRWFHQHARELFPTQRISRGFKPVSDLPRQIQNGLNEMPVPANANSEDQDSVPLLEFLTNTDTDAFLILHNGRIITEQYFAGMAPDSFHYLWSMSKSVSVGVLAHLLALERVHDDAPIVSFVPELKKTAYDGAAVRNLMDMCSGVLYDLGNLNDVEWGDPAMRQANSDVARNHRAQGYFGRLADEAEFGGAYRFMLTLQEKDPDRRQGTQMFYKDPDTFALAWACEKHGCGERFADLVSRHIWSKLGAEYDAHIQCDPAGAAIPASGISATLRDMARWGQAHLRSCNGEDEHVIPVEFVDDVLQTEADARHICESSHLSSDILPPQTAYRSQFWRFPGGPHGALVAGGFLGQYCYIHPDSDVVIVKFSSHRKERPDTFNLELRVLEHLAKQV